MVQRILFYRDFFFLFLFQISRKFETIEININFSDENFAAFHDRAMALEFSEFSKVKINIRKIPGGPDPG